MIERIAIGNFKSLRDVDLSLGRMNLLIGTNASGKSNFLDALRVLQGIGNGFTINEILDGKPRSSTSEVWESIRGGSSRARYIDAKEEVRIAVEGRFATGRYRRWGFLIAFLPEEGKVTRESLRVGKDLYDSNIVSRGQTGPVLEVRYHKNERGRPPHLKFERSRPVISQFAEGDPKWKKSDSGLAARVLQSLANMQRLDPSPALLRDYSQAHRIQRMGDHGENFAALVRMLSEDESWKDAYLSWLRQLRPEEIDDVGTLSGAVGEPLFMLRESGMEFPAPVLSDGTLRFAAIAAAFFQPDMPDLMTIEEIENGIHANRVQVLLELVRSQAERTDTQIIATTHSPTVLDWLQEKEYHTTFFCRRDERTGESKIFPLAEVPHFGDVTKTEPVSRLLSEGWLEMAS